MRQHDISYKEFQTEHTWREIVSYIVDVTAPTLTLRVRPWHKIARAVVSIIFFGITALSVAAFVVQSFPRYFAEHDKDMGISSTWPAAVELFCVVMWIFEYLLRMALTVQPVREYVRAWPNVIDVAAIAVYFIELITTSAGGDSHGFRVVFMVRVLRVLKYSRLLPALDALIEAFAATYDTLLLMVVILFEAVVLAGTAYYHVETTEWDDSAHVWRRACAPHQERPGRYNQWTEPTHWAASGVVNNTTVFTLVPGCGMEVSPFQSIPDGMYWAFSAISTLGYGVTAPTTAAGRVVAALTVIAGLLSFTAPATVLAVHFRHIRRRALETVTFRKIDVRTAAAMRAQEKLKREMQYAQRQRAAAESTRANVLFREVRRLDKICAFTFDGVERPIYQVVDQSYYVYPPLCLLDRDSIDASGNAIAGQGEILWTDDMNPTAAQRMLTCLLVLDCDAAREAAKAALTDAEIIPDGVTDNDMLICADPRACITVHHDAACAYPDLATVVSVDELPHHVGATLRDAVPLRFIVTMPHLYPTAQVLALLRETRVTVTVRMCMQEDQVQMPVPVEIVVASRMMRELSEIAHHRARDGALVAYVHPSDAAEMLRGFTEQFLPTPSRDDVVLDPHAVDAQLYHCILSSTPQVHLSAVPAEAASAFYWGRHLSVDLADEPLLEVNLTALAVADTLGFGSKFQVQVPMGRVERFDVQFQLV